MILSKNIPFSYLWTLKRAFGENSEKVLDVGCGNGAFMKDLSSGEVWQITGIDIYAPDLSIAKKSGAYKNLINGDIEKVVKRLIERGNKYDIVFCSQVLEHLTKYKAIKVLKLFDKLATKKIIISTPNGIFHQYEQFLGQNENPYQVHKSGWYSKEFYSLGYKVYGLGFKYLWSDKNLSWRKNNIKKYIFSFINLFFAPFVYFKPSLGLGLLCIKKVN